MLGIQEDDSETQTAVYDSPFQLTKEPCVPARWLPCTVDLYLERTVLTLRKTLRHPTAERHLTVAIHLRG